MAKTATDRRKAVRQNRDSDCSCSSQKGVLFVQKLNSKKILKIETQKRQKNAFQKPPFYAVFHAA